MPTLVTDSSILCWYSRKQDESNSSNSETKWILESNSALLDPSHEMYFNEINAKYGLYRSQAAFLPVADKSSYNALA